MKFLVIQTAFIGDAILATAVVEKLHKFYPDAQIDILVQKGNHAMFDGHPFLRRVLVFDKKARRLRSIRHLLGEIRGEWYDVVINLHRFFSSGFLTVFSNAKKTIGFHKNPLSLLYSVRKRHLISEHGKLHEVQRNLSLITELTDDIVDGRPRLYPPPDAYEKVRKEEPYICIAPASVWHTKQWPEQNWVDLIINFDDRYLVCLLGSKADRDLCERIKARAQKERIVVHAGDLTLLESAALMEGAVMNYVNDSAPMHLASAVNAPVTAVFCSTVPAFGFGPLSDVSKVVETHHALDCRPCGLHGYRTCPEGHFKCSEIHLAKLQINA